MQDKQELRTALVARRRATPAATRAAAGALLAQHLAPLLATAKRPAAYVAVGPEPPTAPLLARWREVLLPVLLADGDLDWALAGELHRGQRGLLEPTGPRLGVDAIRSCDLVIVPALAVDGRGNRLGRGGGSYDRALHRAAGLTVALLYDDELVDAVPVEPHDRPVAAVVTPSYGLVRLPG